MFFPHCAPFFFSCHCPLLLSVLSSVTMTKSKTKSSLLRSTQGDFWLQTNRHTYASRTPMVQSRSCSLVQRGSISSTLTSTPSRTKVAFADFSSATRVSSKHKNKTMQKKKVILLNHFILPLLVVATTAPLAVPGQAPCL